MKTRYWRYGLLTAVLAGVLYLAFGYSSRSFETFCPFGGPESLWGLFRYGEFSCSLGPLNLSLFIGIVVLALIAKKLFCGWVCPIGFFGELLGRIGALFTRGRFQPTDKLDRVLRLIRYPVLVVSLYFTYKLGELILRGYDPFYLVFSGFGHGSAGVISYVVLGVTVVGAILIPMFFCRYLCPLGATLDPFGWLGMIRVRRDAETCTSCGKCRLACPHNLPVDVLPQVRHRDCTNCLECVDACADVNALSLRVGK